MTQRVWKKGPPPHVGWWNASVFQDLDSWRWWNGTHWSFDAWPEQTSEEASKQAAKPSQIDAYRIRWTDYYPVNARVPRVAP